MLLHIAEIVFCCLAVVLFNLFWMLDCDTVPGDLLVIAVITVVSVMTVLTVILFQVFSCDIWSAVSTVILFHLFCCFTDSIPMIIVKKIQIPNIFCRFTKKYYSCHICHIISADLPGFWLKNTKTHQLVPKNGIF